MYVFGPFRFDAATGQLRRGDSMNRSTEVPLPPRAQALLSLLVESPRRLFTRDELLGAVWGGVHVSDTSLKEAIHVLRQALDDDPRSPSYLETIPRRGYRFVAEVRREAAAPVAADTGTPSWRQVPRWRLVWWAGGMAFGLVLAALLIAQRRPPAIASAAVAHRFEIPLPPEHAVTPGPANLALSPDGRFLAYVAKSRGTRRLFLRPVGRLEAAAFKGTEGASAPFFSPDGRSIAFFTADALRRVPTGGGEVETLCEVPRGLGGSWGRHGIVMSLLDSRDNTGLWQVPASGGRPRVLTTRLEGEAAHRWPEVLPGELGVVVFTVWRSGFDDAEVAILDLETGQRRRLFDGSHARFVPPGHLVFVRGEQLWAVQFDLRRRQLSGAARPVLGGVATTPVLGTAHFAVASTGSLVFMPRRETPPPVLRRFRDGESERVRISAPLEVGDLRLSPDQRRLAVSAPSDSGLDLWIVDLDRGSVSRRTFDGASLAPVWSPDGEWLLYTSTRDGVTGLFRIAAAGGDDGELLWTGGSPAAPTSWSPDGTSVAFSRLDPRGGWDLWRLRLAEGGGPGLEADAEPWLDSPYDETRGVFSPDGRHLAYESDETGRREVYVRALPDTGARWPVSTEGGSHPLWSPDGGRIWFRRGAEIYAVGVRLEPAVEIGRPERRFEGLDVPGYNLAVGDADVLVLEPRKSGAASLTFVVHGLAEALPGASARGDSTRSRSRKVTEPPRNGTFRPRESPGSRSTPRGRAAGAADSPSAAIRTAE